MDRSSFIPLARFEQRYLISPEGIILNLANNSLDKEQYLAEVLSGTQVSVIAIRLGRRPETLHKMLRDTAKRLGIHDQWEAQMRENRKRVAIRNLEAFDFRHPKRKQS